MERMYTVYELMFIEYVSMNDNILFYDTFVNINGYDRAINKYVPVFSYFLGKVFSLYV